MEKNFIQMAIWLIFFPPLLACVIVKNLFYRPKSLSYLFTKSNMTLTHSFIRQPKVLMAPYTLSASSNEEFRQIKSRTLCDKCTKFSVQTASLYDTTIIISNNYVSLMLRKWLAKCLLYIFLYQKNIQS